MQVPHNPRRRRWRMVRERSAVAVVLRQGVDDVEVLLVKRAARNGDPWSGHIAFPGGRSEPDEDSVTTAIRETSEELGIALGAPIGRLPAKLTRTHRNWRPMAVDPVVFPSPSHAPSITPNYEVASWFWVPLATLRDPDVRVRRPWKRMPMPAWKVGEHVIWGLTHAMLVDLLRVIR